MTKKKAAPKKTVSIFSSEKIAEMIGECAAFLEMEPSEVAWNDFQTWAKEEEKSVSALQRSFRAAGGYNAIRDAFFPAKPTLAKQERRIIGKHALVNRRDGRHEADREVFLAQIEEFSQKCFKGRVSGFKTRKQLKPVDRVVTLLISDLHLGSDLSGLETDTGAYGVLEESRRVARVVYEASQFKTDHRDRTRLVVNLAGDLIEGILHDPREGAPQAMQVCRAIHVLSQALAYLAQAYSQVDVYAVSGNHDRITSRHPGRAIAGKYDSFGTIIHFALKSSLEKLGNIRFHIPMTPWVRWKSLGHNVFSTHSDTVLSGHGYLGSNVAVKSLEAGINLISAGMADEDRPAVVCVGHSHIPLCVDLPNGVTMIANGSIKPLDSYVASMGRSSVRNNSQTLFESTPDFPVGDYRNLRVGVKDDVDAGLDSIIQPFQGL